MFNSVLFEKACESKKKHLMSIIVMSQSKDRINCLSRQRNQSDIDSGQHYYGTIILDSK